MLSPSRSRIFAVALTLFVAPVLSNAQAKRGADQPYLLHLPGIGGYMFIDRSFVGGLKEGKFDAIYESYDWTCRDPGLDALLARKRNEAEAQKVAEKLTSEVRAHPHRRVIVTSHSGGTGIAVWALEKLPADVTIDTLLLMSPALSPQYDLSKALRHVTGKVYVFSSVNDTLVLGIGTSMFGTIDGVKSESAGLKGFVKPHGADETQYEKLVPLPYNPQWMQYNNIGDHIGSMSRAFSREIVAPLVREGKVPELAPATTQPVGAEAAQSAEGHSGT
jgi:hypothetical protein